MSWPPQQPRSTAYAYAEATQPTQPVQQATGLRSLVRGTELQPCTQLRSRSSSLQRSSTLPREISLSTCQLLVLASAAASEQSLRLRLAYAASAAAQLQACGRSCRTHALGVIKLTVNLVSAVQGREAELTLPYSTVALPVAAFAFAAASKCTCPRLRATRRAACAAAAPAHGEVQI